MQEHRLPPGQRLHHVALRALSNRIAQRNPIPDRTPVHIDHHMGAQAPLIVEHVGAKCGVIANTRESASDTGMSLDPGALYDEVPPKVRREVNGRHATKPGIGGTSEVADAALSLEGAPSGAEPIGKAAACLLDLGPGSPGRTAGGVCLHCRVPRMPDPGNRGA